MSMFLPRAVARFVLPLSLTGLLIGAACSDAATSPIAQAGVSLSAPVDTMKTTPTSPAAPTDTTAPTTPTPSPAPAQPATPTVASALIGARLYVDPNSNARKTADAWRAGRPADAAQMDKIAAQSQAVWIGDWNTNVAADVNRFATTITNAGAVPVFVAYNIPQRDCGGLSGGNNVAASQYKTWIDGFAAGIGARRAVVILEPDALANMDCLSSADQQTRLGLIAYAVAAFNKLGATSVYIDAGHAHWQSASTMASRLRAAGIADAAGFSLNVSNFVSDADNIAYGQQLGALVGGKHFVIDSSRNGLGPAPDAQWCNPSGRALGTRPTTNTGVAGLDAFLWIKSPGESDGSCNGAPASGAWWAEYALGLAQRAAY
jgi:endoglucanase